MTQTARRKITITFQGDIAGEQEYDADDVTASIATTLQVPLTTGNNTIALALPDGVVPKSVTILKPSDNTATITLKGNTGDTGVALHATDPDSISLADGDGFVLTVSADVTVRLVFT